MSANDSKSDLNKSVDQWSSTYHYCCVKKIFMQIILLRLKAVRRILSSLSLNLMIESELRKAIKFLVNVTIKILADK